MPWKDPKQRAAIAAQMARDGKSQEEISAFFRKHGHGKNLSGAIKGKRRGK